MYKKYLTVNNNMKRILSCSVAVVEILRKFWVNNLGTLFEKHYWSEDNVKDVDSDVFEDVIDPSHVSVSHTTDDLVFEWDPIMPLDVDSGIELPQLELTNNFTGDCTTAYSTGDTVAVGEQALAHWDGMKNLVELRRIYGK